MTRQIVLAERHRDTQHVIVSRKLDPPSRRPYVVKIVTFHQLTSEKNALDFCRKNFGFSWNLHADRGKNQ